MRDWSRWLGKISAATDGTVFAQQEGRSRDPKDHSAIRAWRSQRTITGALYPACWKRKIPVSIEHSISKNKFTMTILKSFDING